MGNKHPVSALIASAASGPHAAHTRRLCPGLVKQVDELIDEADVDIKLLGDQLDAVAGRLPLPITDLSTSAEWIDLRLTTQHLLVSSARLLPLLSSALADLYLTRLSAVAVGKRRHRGRVLERSPWESARQEIQSDVREAARRLRRDWGLLRKEKTTGTAVLANWDLMARTVACLSEVHTCCIEILNGMTRAEFGR